jgi:hypothetical protein
MNKFRGNPCRGAHRAAQVNVRRASSARCSVGRANAQAVQPVTRGFSARLFGFLCFGWLAPSQPDHSTGRRAGRGCVHAWWGALDAAQSEAVCEGGDGAVLSTPTAAHPTPQATHTAETGATHAENARRRLITNGRYVLCCTGGIVSSVPHSALVSCASTCSPAHHV